MIVIDEITETVKIFEDLIDNRLIKFLITFMPIQEVQTYLEFYMNIPSDNPVDYLFAVLDWMNYPVGVQQGVVSYCRYHAELLPLWNNSFINSPEAVKPEDYVALVRLTLTISLLAGSAVPATYAAGLYAKRKLYDRTGEKMLKVRGTSSFTDVMDYLFKLCTKDNKELLIPGNIEKFMGFAKKLVEEGKSHNDHVAERIKKVCCGGMGYFEMQEGYGKAKTKKGIDPNKYPRSQIQNELSALRKKYIQSVK